MNNITLRTTSTALQLHCSTCGKTHTIHEVQSVSTCCESALLVDYDLDLSIDKSELSNLANGMWRYESLLPVFERANRVSMGEGMTPLISLRHTFRRFGFENVYLKDESGNPTGSFKARGISVAVSKALELGVETVVIPTAGNAGGALSAYGKRAGLNVIVVMPRLTPEPFKEEVISYGAELILVDGLINSCGKMAQKIEEVKNAFNMSTLMEPYRIEGKKTMGLEIVEQLKWEVPDVIIYPTGGGTGIIGIWKALQEMEILGWIDSKRPRMIAVQSENCQPVVDALANKTINPDLYKPSVANGLVVPNPVGLTMITNIINVSGGKAISVKEEDIMLGIDDLANSEGILPSPEGGAVWAAFMKMLEARELHFKERIVLMNTASGYKYSGQ